MGGLDLAYVDLLLRGNVGESRGAAFGKDFVPEFGKPPYDGEDNAFSDQDTEDISRDLSTIRSRVQELVGFAQSSRVSMDKSRTG